ncbi:MAG: hypothetical protein E7Z90_01105 [Cyanobacteria bacterium SIG29]|nr:hypothetical protein [Cyanobacteria bacterium SIG29]
MKKLDLILKIGIVLLLLIIVFVHIDFAFLYTKHSFFSGYFCNIATECIGLILTVCLIQQIINKRDENKEKLEEKMKILRQHKIVSIYFQDYIKCFHCVTTPINNRFIDGIDFKKDFKINELYDLHETSLDLSLPINESSIKSFYKYEHKLRDEFIRMLNNIDFKYYTEFISIISEFIQSSVASDISDAIINNERLNMGSDKKISDVVSEMLKQENSQELYIKFKKGEFSGNIIIPYFVLFDLLKKEQQLLLNYLEKIDNLT